MEMNTLSSDRKETPVVRNWFSALTNGLYAEPGTWALPLLLATFHFYGTTLIDGVGHFFLLNLFSTTGTVIDIVE